MAFFTSTIYNAIMVSVSGGDISPLVGHNAFLRWSAIKECAFVDPDDGKTKFWSDVHVSEDFDIAMRFQVHAHSVPYCSQIFHIFLEYFEDLPKDFCTACGAKCHLESRMNVHAAAELQI